MRNGTVAMLTGTAIVIEAGCSAITIENMKFSQCASGVIEMLGTSTSDYVKDVTIESCIIQSCCLSPLAQNAVLCNYTHNLFLNNVRVLNSGNAASPFEVFKFINCDRCVLFTVGVASSLASNFIAFEFENCETFLCKECRVANNWADPTTGTLTGFNFTGTCANNIFSDSLVLTNSAGSDLIGINVDGDAKSIMTGQSRVASNYSANGDVYGFRFKGYGSPSTNHDNGISQTFILSNRSDGAGKMVAGIMVDNCDSSIVDNCIVAFQQSSAGSAYGMLFTSTGGGDNWSVQQTQFTKNDGDSNANSYGISVEGGTGNLFIKNFAFDNGDTAANQMFGVSTGSITELNTDNLNNSQSPWANIVVTS